MKTILISSVVSLAIGFTFGWLIKSASNDLESIAIVPAQTQRKQPRPVDHAANPIPERNKPRSEQSPDTLAVPSWSPNGTAAASEKESKQDRAKWMRLIEVLGLDTDQTKTLEAAISEAIPSGETEEPLDVVLANAGARLEKNILAILTPEQREAFEKFQQRALDNRIEVTAQKSYAQELGNLDLSPEQREQTLDLLRKEAQKNASTIPASTRLLLTDSVLPVGGHGLSPDAIRLLKEINTPVDPSSDAFENLLTAHKAEIEQKMDMYEGILTPAQLARLRVKLSESSDILDQIKNQK